MAERAEVVIVGGGPAGAALAIGLAESGVDVAVLERWPEPRWRAAGVYSSPLTRSRLAHLGLSDAEVGTLVRPIAAMEVVSPRGTLCRLEYAEAGHACGLDRVRLERVLLGRAAAAGARVHEGSVVRLVEVAARPGGETRLQVSPVTRPGRQGSAGGREGDSLEWRARLVVGADGPGSLVARAHGLVRPARWLRHVGLTRHRHDPEAAPAGEPMTAHMYIADGWYCGVAPVPGARVNLGLVVSESRFRREAHGGTERMLEEAVAALPGPLQGWRSARDTDELAVALPLAHRVARRAAPGVLLVGDAAGFLDPLSGEGLHRALVGADLATEAILRWSRGDGDALVWYDRQMRQRFAAKDRVSWLLQLFLAQPRAMEYAVRRLADRASLRATFADVLSDRQPAGRVLDPRYLSALLRP